MTETPQQAYISKVHLKGYKSIRDLEIDFKPGLNIIIGPNGSGKTNFLEFLVAVFSQELNTINTSATIEYFEDEYFQLNYVVEKYKSLKNATRTIFSLRKNNEKKAIEDSFITTPDGQKTFFQRATQEQLILDWVVMDSRINFIKYGVEREFNLLFSHNFSLSINEDGIEDAYINNENDFIFNLNLLDIFVEIEGDYINTEEFRNLCFNQIAIKKELADILAQFTPIRDLKIDKNKLQIYTTDSTLATVDNIEVKFKVGGEWLLWTQLSDGTKRLFYLFTSIYTTSESTIAIEEPELGIHPDQLYKLMDFLKEQSKEKQIIITTHSPDVLNILGADELDRIIVTKNDNEKGTIMRKLQAPQIEKARRYMESAGLFLSDYWVHSDLEAAAYETEEED